MPDFVFYDPEDYCSDDYGGYAGLREEEEMQNLVIAMTQNKPVSLAVLSLVRLNNVVAEALNELYMLQFAEEAEELDENGEPVVNWEPEDDSEEGEDTDGTD